LQTIRCASIDELTEVSKTILNCLEGKSIVIFKGEMGAGKTTSIKNICNFLGVKDAVSSPTFSLVNEYEGKQGAVIYHFDFYRIEEEEEALDIGCEDYFESGHLCLIEWPERIESLLPEERLEVEIKTQGEERIFNITSQN
jgi:tRNA threonylcarbamoyladenosine biosynthesis protein TsaE